MQQSRSRERESKLQIASRYITVVVSRTGNVRPETSKGHPVPWVALLHGDVVHVIRVEAPRGYHRHRGRCQPQTRRIRNYYAMLAFRLPADAAGYVGRRSSRLALGRHPVNRSVDGSTINSPDPTCQIFFGRKTRVAYCHLHDRPSPHDRPTPDPVGLGSYLAQKPSLRRRAAR